MQTELTKMVITFQRFGLQTNLNKTKAMICRPGFIWGQQGAEAYKRRATGEGPKFRERKKTRVSCEECGETMHASSLQHHTERANGIVLPQMRGVEVGGGILDVYKVSFSQILKLGDCPVEVFPAKAKTPGRLRENLMFCHWELKVAILQEGP